MNKELKKAIILWLFEHANEWQRTNACINNFRAYIYDNEGNYLIGGDKVANFIRVVESIIYVD